MQIEEIIPDSYYTRNMLSSHIDQNVFKTLINERLPQLAQAFQNYSVAVSAITAQWFLCLFVSVTPAEV
jgi:TBC1 domain family member 8/9